MKFMRPQGARPKTTTNKKKKCNAEFASFYVLLNVLCR